MKKVAVALMLVCVGLTFFGCGQSTFDVVKANMSERTDVYYYGENEDFYCALSSGQREEAYKLDGKNGKCVDFALLSLTFGQTELASIIKVEVSIDGNKTEQELELNTLNNAYMVDLEQKLTGDETIEITYQDVTLTLENISKNFGVNSDEALEIATQELGDKITAKKNYQGLNAECYLRVMDKRANNFDGVFWCFTVLNVDNEQFSIIISTENGEILAKSN